MIKVNGKVYPESIKRKAVDRKVVQSFTISKELLKETRAFCVEVSFSKYTCDALIEYNKKCKS
jgi:hypothetical protein